MSSRFRKAVKAVIPQSAFQKIEPLGHGIEAMLQSARYGFPAQKLRIIGVTGTNGKTTTSFMIHKMLHEAGYKVGLMTTVAYGVGDDIKPQMEHMTTVSPGLLNKRIAEIAAAGAEWLVLETTSHALAQHRVWGVPYEIAVLTNLTHEHLDYHGTFEHYKAAKRRLFQIANRHPKGYGIVNADDPNAESFTSAITTSVTYGIDNGDIRASNISLGAHSSDFSATIGDERYHIHCNIPGKFNISNSLAALAVGRRIGLTKTQIEKGLAALTSVEGRMNTIDEGQKFSVVVDFAHTPDSFERLLSDLRESTHGKLIVLFGSAGHRDEAKRWTQGEIAGKYADEVVLTEEDDRDVDGNLILSQIAEGAARSGKVKDKDLFLILDRPEAITFAVSRAHSADDTIVLLGKGHEKTIERADGTHPWNEIEEARKALRANRT